MCVANTSSRYIFLVIPKDRRINFNSWVLVTILLLASHWQFGKESFKACVLSRMNIH